jgi:hypothetical protein
MASLERGFYEFQFTSYEDTHLAWSMGTTNLKPWILWLSKWTNDFNTHSPRQTHAQIWIWLMEFPQEYCHPQTLFEIASAIGTPLTLDESTKNKAFRHYACVLVDILIYPVDCLTRLWLNENVLLLNWRSCTNVFLYFVHIVLLLGMISLLVGSVRLLG